MTTATRPRRPRPRRRKPRRSRRRAERSTTSPGRGTTFPTRRRRGATSTASSSSRRTSGTTTTSRRGSPRAAARYDLITYYQGYKPLYQELGILSPIDISKVPNIDNEFPYFKSDVGNFWIDADGTWTGVPWTFGSIGITWDDEALPGGLTSWYDLLDPKLENKIGLPDDPVGSFTLAAHTLGYDPAMVTQDQKTEIVDLLTQIVSHARSVAPSFGDMTTQLVNGDIVACWQGWAAMNSFAADAGKDTVMTTVPEEGSFSFCDLYAIPTTADNVDTVYSYLNNVLEPEVNAAAAEFLVGGVTVEGAVEFLDEATRSLYPYEDLDGLLERAPFYNNPPVESDEFVTYEEWIDTWQEVKAST